MKPPVILITDSLSRRRGGAEIYLANLAGFLVQHGHAVHVLVRRDSADFSMPGVTVETLPVAGSGLRGEKNLVRAVRQRLRGDEPIVYSTIALPGLTHYQPHMGLLRRGFKASRDSRNALFFRSVHAFASLFNMKRRWLLKMQEQLLTRASTTKVMVFSQLVHRQVLEDYSLPPANLTIAPLGVDLERFQPGEKRTHAPADKLKLLFTAHNFQLKGLHCLLVALGRAKKDGLKAELHIVGNGHRNAFEKIAARLGVSDDIKFLGLVDGPGAAALYRSSDVLVHPTFTDHCSLVVLEALASGLPVITTRQNGAAEFIESEKSGIIIGHPRDIPALADALLRLQDRQKLAAMSTAAAALRPRLDFTHHAQAVLAWLNTR
ncbi:MAG TPA: glycosyltransferase family 4 protein [Verrucomicrobiae bacterium]|nr:glycosyltransferase family 4 protein [Verrucomicrobiae bacterium]